MLLSKTAEYGIRAALHVAQSSDNVRYVPIRRIADALSIPYHFLAKVAQSLIAGGVFVSSRGPHGGVALARPANDITLMQIVQILDGEALFRECVLGLPECGNRKPCPLHEEWAPARARIAQMLNEARLGELAAGVSEGEFRLADLATN